MIKGIMKLFNKVKTAISGAIEYPVNDPATQLVIQQQIPELPNPCPPFVVQGFTGQSGAKGSSQWQAAGVYTMIANSLRFVNSKIDNPLTRWIPSHLIAFPRAGVQFNAYYDRSTLRFFYNKHPQTGKYVFTCESSDVVSHELGHAILDVLRPDLWATQSIEVFAFHESFGDINAIMAALSHEEIIDFVLRETNGNLRQSNIVSRIAEEMGGAIYAMMNRPADALRNAVNDFKYEIPEKLPSNTADTQLNREPHNFSRVFTGTFYDVLVNQFEKNSKELPVKEALIQARDQVASVFYNAIPQAANTIRFFDSVARAMLISDNQRGCHCKESLWAAFSSRQIMQTVPLMATATATKIDDKDAKVYRHRGGSVVRVGGVKQARLIDEMALTQSDNPLYSINVDIPNEHYIEYDNKGRLKLDRPVVKEVTLGAVKSCLDYLHQADKVSYEELAEPDKEFTVINGRLVRNFICCNRCKHR